MVVFVISKTSGHFEWASTAMKYILSMNGPAKSIWTLCQGFKGQVQGWSGVLDGACFTARHGWQDFASCSISRSILGHQYDLELMTSSDLFLGGHDVTLVAFGVGYYHTDPPQ